MNARNGVRQSPIDTYPLLKEYIKNVKKGANKKSVKSIRKFYKAEDYESIKLEMAKLPVIGQIKSDESLNNMDTHLDWSYYGLMQIEIPDEGRKSVDSFKSDKHTMIEHRNVLDNGYVLWFYFEGSYSQLSEAIDVLKLYFEAQYGLKLDLDKYKKYGYKLEVGYNPKIYTNPQAAAFNFKYLKKKYATKIKEVA